MKEKLVNELANELVKNEDFKDLAEFNEELENDRDEVVDFLQWRVNDGHFRNEEVTQEYKEACKELLNLI